MHIRTCIHSWPFETWNGPGQSIECSWQLANLHVYGFKSDISEFINTHVLNTIMKVMWNLDTTKIDSSLSWLKVVCNGKMSWAYIVA